MAAGFALFAIAAGLLLHGGGRYYFGPFESDLTASFYPTRVFVKRWFNRGIFPLWDPHIFSGFPVLETQQMCSLNPIRLVSILLFNPRLGLLMEAAAYTGVALITSWFALRRNMRCSAPATLLGCVAFVFGGLYTMRVGGGQFTVIAAICWWPLAIGLTHQLARSLPPATNFRTAVSIACRTADARLPIIWLALVNAMVMLSGGPQYFAYLFWMEVAVLLATSRSRLSALLCCGVSWGLALCLSAPQWLPAFWYLPFSGRASASGGGGMMGPAPTEQTLLLWELLMPHPLGDDLRHPHLYQKAAWETCTYPGAVALVLTIGLLLRLASWPVLQLVRRIHSDLNHSDDAAPGLTNATTPDRITAHGQLVPVVLIALGVYLVLGGWLPGFGSFRETIKARAIVALGIAWAAAIEFDRLLACSRRLKCSFVYIVAAIGLSGFALWMSRLVAQPGWFQELMRQFPPPMDSLSSALYAQVLQDPTFGVQMFQQAATWTAAWSMVIGVLMVGMIYTHGRTRQVILAGCLLAASVDLVASHAHAFYSYRPCESMELQQDLRSCLESTIVQERAAGVIPWRLTLPSNVINKSHLLDGLMETGGYDPLMPAYANGRTVLDMETTGADYLTMLHQAIGRRVDCSGSFRPADAESMCTSCTVIASHAQLVDIERNTTIGIPARAHTFGPAENNLYYVGQGTSEWLIDEKPRVTIDQRTAIENVHVLPALTSGHGTAPGETLHVDTPRAPQLLTAHVDLVEPALVVYRTTWLPGWKVRIDVGKWTDTLCANRWMVCTTVDAGKHRVEFRYRPVALIPSVIIACFTWAAMLAYLLVAGLKRRRMTTTPA